MQAPGDLVEIDTLDVRPVPGVVLKQFTSRDVVSRWDCVELAHRATASTAKRLLDPILRRMPFAVRAIQVDGGSEFMAEFEEECRDRGIRLFILPPRSPKLNGHVERANRTHTEEFYHFSTANPTVAELGVELREWETVYNTIRPHQALNYLTPKEFLDNWKEQHTRKEERVKSNVNVTQWWCFDQLIMLLGAGSPFWLIGWVRLACQLLNGHSRRSICPP